MVLAFGALASCGGGGSGGGGASLATLSGTYGFVRYAIRDDVPDEGQAEWGFAISDGAGLITGGFGTTNTAGSLSGPSPVGGDSYSVASDGTIALGPFGGGLASDGSAAVLAPIDTNQDPGVLCLLKREGSFTDASVQGTYHILLYGFAGSTLDITYLNRKVSLDGVGTGTISAGQYNADGSVNAASADLLSYAVGPTGVMTAALLGVNYSGQVLQGGNLVFLARNTSATDGQGLLILIREGSGLSTGTFSGDYHAVGFQTSVSGAFGWGCISTKATANGSGLLSFAAGTRNTDGVVGGTAPYDTDCSVASDGSMTMQAGLFVGGVASNGRFAALCGGTAANSDPTIWIFVR